MRPWELKSFCPCFMVHEFKPAKFHAPSYGDRTERFYRSGCATHCYCHKSLQHVSHTVIAISPCNIFPWRWNPRFWPKKSFSHSSPSVMFFLSRTVRFSLFPLFSLSNPFKPKEPSTSTYWSCSSYLCDVTNLNVTRLILDKQIVKLVVLDIDGILT